MVLPASMRLKGHRPFDLLHRSGIRFHGSLMVLRVVEAQPNLLRIPSKKFETTTCRCAVAISSKVSKRAVIRNRIRRLLHDHLRLRLSNSTNHSNRWALISLKPNSLKKSSIPLLKECDKLLRDSGLLP